MNIVKHIARILFGIVFIQALKYTITMSLKQLRLHMSSFMCHATAVILIIYYCLTQFTLKAWRFLILPQVKI